ncbi:MAG: pilus assembly protein TadG-related protein [Bryobacteraceae bacterium]
MKSSVLIRRGKRERGAALLLMTLALPFGLMLLSLALEVGWGAYTKKRAQSAADAAALAAITQARQQMGQRGTPTCGTVNCQNLTACPAPGVLQAACNYAEANAIGNSQTRTIKVAAGVGGQAPNGPDLVSDYWVQVTVENRVAQWFSGWFTSSGLRPKATAVAALRNTPAGASMYLLNRKTDCFASALGLGVVCGENLLTLGFNNVVAQGGIYMASSNKDGIGLPGVAAGAVVGTLQVSAPFTRLLGQGGIQGLLGLGSAAWQNPPENGFPDGDMFQDPMAGLGQPPLATGLTNRPVPLGTITGSLLPGSPTLLQPGHYYSSLPLLGTPTGLPIVITGNVKFGDGQNPPCGGFCEYVFHGGVVTAALSTVTMSPGRYVFAGAKAVAGLPTIGLTIGANGTLKDLTPVVNGQITQNTDAGEILIFTDSHYPGLQLPAGINGLNLSEVRAGVSAGVNPTVVLHGLNANHAAVPATLKPFAPVLIWQDQANTTLSYTPTGRLDTSCGTICTKILSVPGSQEMVLQASGGLGGTGTQYYGTIYGPRASWLTIAGLLPNDRVAGQYQIITGALQLAVNASLDMKALPSAPSRLRAALIQ